MESSAYISRCAAVIVFDGFREHGIFQFFFFPLKQDKISLKKMSLFKERRFFFLLGKSHREE